MTTQQQLEQMLIQRGMSQSQATEVIEAAKPSIAMLGSGYAVTYDRPADEYPRPVYMALWYIIKPIALKWIEDNKPQAWFKPAFE